MIAQIPSGRFFKQTENLLCHMLTHLLRARAGSLSAKLPNKSFLKCIKTLHFNKSEVFFSLARIKSWLHLIFNLELYFWSHTMLFKNLTHNSEQGRRLRACGHATHARTFDYTQHMEVRYKLESVEKQHKQARVYINGPQTLIKRSPEVMGCSPKC